MVRFSFTSWDDTDVALTVVAGRQRLPLSLCQYSTDVDLQLKSVARTHGLANPSSDILPGDNCRSYFAKDYVPEPGEKLPE